MAAFSVEKTARAMALAFGSRAYTEAIRFAGQFCLRGQTRDEYIWREIAAAIKRQERLRAAIEPTAGEKRCFVPK